MNLVKVSISLLTLAMASHVSAQATVPSEEEKSALTVYMIQTHVDDPVFVTDIDENLTFSVNSQRLSDETLITNTCLLTNLTQIGSGDRISPMYYRQGVDIALDANLYLVNSVYELYGIQNLAQVLSKDSEQGLKTWATDFGLDLKFAEHCRNSRESGNSSYLNGYDNTDVYFLPRYIYERWLELGDETAQKITSSDVIGTWDYDSIKAMSDEYLLELEEQNKIKAKPKEIGKQPGCGFIGNNYFSELNGSRPLFILLYGHEDYETRRLHLSRGAEFQSSLT